MQQFIYNIFQFFENIYTSIESYGTLSDFSTFSSANILNGDLINISCTWGDLLTIVLPTITLFFFIILIFKLFINMISLFTK